MTSLALSGGLARFRDELHRALVDQVLGWANDPELGKLTASLQAINEREPFLNTYAEAMVARHLLEGGCRLEVEVLTPAGRSCDFRVAREEAAFYLHIKRLSGGRAGQRRLNVSSRLRYLERVARPYVVSVRYDEALDDAGMQRFVTEAAAFVRQARVGDETIIRDARGAEIGGCRIIAPWAGSRVSVVIGLPSGFTDEVPRIRRLLRKAYRQFMPGATNVILICSDHVEDAEDVATALLGSHIERWDAMPPDGQRVAHGRDTDGFWHGRRAPGAHAAGWFILAPGAASYHGRLWIRSNGALDVPMQNLLRDLFGNG